MSNRTLLMIDVQRNMLLPPHPVPDAPTVGPKIAEILERARHSGVTVSTCATTAARTIPTHREPRAGN
jgi:nicotinamidase-related amidase